MRHPTYTIINSIINPPSRKRGLVVLDAGCGNGLLLSYLKSTKIKKYIGIDISNDAIGEGKRKFRQRKNVVFKLGSCIESSLSNSSVDLVISIGVLQYLSNKERNLFLKEAKRVLRPGGQLILSCLTDHFAYKAMDVYGLFSPHGWVNRARLLHALKKAGLEQISAREYGILVAPSVSGIFCLGADAIDYVLFGTRGRIGKIGLAVRSLFENLIFWESRVPIDYGYTLIVSARATS